MASWPRGRSLSGCSTDLEKGGLLVLGVWMKYTVVVQHSEEGVAASVPGLPGCWSQSATEGEALENIRTAIAEYLSVVREQTSGADVREVEVTV